MKKILFCLAVLLSCNLITHARTVSADDSTALVALYNSAGGASWIDKWDLNTPVNTWFGVKVESKRVVELDLHLNKLVGKVPTQIELLTELKVLALQGNDFTGDIEPKIGQLVKLTSLDLRGCKLTGAVPSSFENLVKLESLGLNHNSLTSFPSGVVAKLVALKYATLESNELGNLPDFSALPNISGLKVDNNRLHFDDIIRNFRLLSKSEQHYIPQKTVRTGKTYSIAGRSKIVLRVNVRGANNKYRWYFGGEVVAGATADSLVLTNLASATGNYYCEITNPAVSNNLKLRSEDDVLIGGIALNAGDSSALIRLYSSTRGMNWITPWNLSSAAHTWHGVVVKNGRVVGLRLKSNNLNGTIPSEIGNLTELNYISLANNKLAGAIPTTIGNLTKLKDLFLWGNELSGPIPSQIGNLKALEILNLQNNQLTSIPPQIGGLTNLTELGLNRNALTGRIPAEIGQLSNLLVCNLEHNKLNGSVPEEIGNLRNLRTLAISHNQLSGIFPTSIRNLKNLNILLAANNRIEGFRINNLENDWDRERPRFIRLELNRLHWYDLVNFLNFRNDSKTITVPGLSNPIPPKHNLGLTPQIIRDGSSQDIFERSDITLKVSIKNVVFEDGTTLYHFHWYKNGVRINSADSLSDSVLVLKNLQDSVVYHCEVRTNNAPKKGNPISGGKPYAEGFVMLSRPDTLNVLSSKPTALNLSKTTVRENTPSGSVIGTFTTADPNPKDTHTYTLGGTDASAFNINANTLETKAPLDFETKNSYSITVTTTDNIGLTLVRQFTIIVQDVDESVGANRNPTALSLSESTIRENAPVGSFIGKLTTTDPDAGDTHTYTLSGEDASSFRINGSNLENSSVFDFETKKSYNIIITSTDRGNLTIAKRFTITVIDVVDESVPTALPVLQPNTSEPIVIYPNPTSGIIKIKNLNQAKAVYIEIISPEGQVVKTYNYSQNSYDLSDLAKGIYIIKAKIDGKIHVESIILN